METRPVILFDLNLKASAVSPGSAELLGLSGQELIGRSCQDLFRCPTCNGAGCPLRKALAGEPAAGMLHAHEGQPALTIATEPVRGQLGACCLATLQWEERSQAQAVATTGLQRALESLRQMLQSDLAALAFYDTTQREIRWQVTSGSINPDVARIRLRPGQGFAGRIVMTDLPLQTFRFPQDLTGDPESYPIFLAEGLKSALGVPVRGEGQVLGVLMVACRSERIYTEEDQNRLLGVADSISLAAEMILINEEALRKERAKLAQEVHDGLSQNLFGLQLLLADAQKNIHSDTPAMQGKGLADICEVLDSTLTEVRRLIRDLRGSSRARTGLVSAVSDYLGHFYRMSNLQVELALQLPPGEEVVCSDAHELLRVLQEALMNVHRHSGATRARVVLGREADAYRLTVEDNGSGFDPASAVPDGHYGLAIMRERAARMGARLEIDSAPGRGTTVTLRMPA